MTLPFVICIKLDSLCLYVPLLMYVSMIHSSQLNRQLPCFSIMISYMCTFTIDGPWLFAWIQDRNDKTDKWTINENDRYIAYSCLGHVAHQSDQWTMNLFRMSKISIRTSPFLSRWLLFCKRMTTDSTTGAIKSDTIPQKRYYYN